MNTVTVTPDSLKIELEHVSGQIDETGGLFPKAGPASASIKAMHGFMAARTDPFDNQEGNPYVKGGSGGGGGGGGSGGGSGGRGGGRGGSGRCAIL